MAIQSTTKIYIGGTEITAFQRIILQQEIDAHHIFEIVCRMDVLEKLSTELASESKNFLGETLTMEIESLDSFSGYKKLEFKGLVTQVRNVKGYEQSSGDTVVITAQSPTFLADDGPHYASYLDTSISEIVEKTFREYDTSKLELQIEPVNDTPLHYSVQHHESCYEYVSRLAAQYGEWFYYNGKKVIFGKPESEELALTYGFDLKEYHLNLIPKSHNYKFYTKDYLLDEVHEKDAKEVTSGVNGYSGFVNNKAETIFNKETKIWHNLYNDQKSKQRLDKSIELQKKAIEIQQVKLTGISDNPGVALGNIVKVDNGKYRVIRVTHSNNENGDYRNRFEAVTAEFNAYPNTNIEAFPRSQSQTAVVVDNADPDGLGRIKVEFPWQKDIGEETPWIRIVAPHAGGDKGFHFIPEKGEEVLIGFEGGNAEKPYVMGSLYNGGGKAEAFKNNKNDIKAIKTRSGSMIEFNDKNGSETITIVDKNGNSITIDSENNSISITALDSISLESTDISITASNELSLTSGAKTTIETGTELSVAAATKAAVSAGAKIEMSAPSTNIQGATQLKLESNGIVDVNGTGMTNVKGGLVNLNCG